MTTNFASNFLNTQNNNHKSNTNFDYTNIFKKTLYTDTSKEKPAEKPFSPIQNKIIFLLQNSCHDNIKKLLPAFLDKIKKCDPFIKLLIKANTDDYKDIKEAEEEFYVMTALDIFFISSPELNKKDIESTIYNLLELKNIKCDDPLLNSLADLIKKPTEVILKKIQIHQEKYLNELQSIKNIIDIKKHIETIGKVLLLNLIVL
jgi:hypothetical protein